MDNLSELTPRRSIWRALWLIAFVPVLVFGTIYSLYDEIRDSVGLSVVREFTVQVPALHSTLQVSGIYNVSSSSLQSVRYREIDPSVWKRDLNFNVVVDGHLFRCNPAYERLTLNRLQCRRLRASPAPSDALTATLSSNPT